MKRLGGCVLLLKVVILLCVGKTDDELLAALQVTVRGIAPLRVIHARITWLADKKSPVPTMLSSLPDHDGGDDIRGRLKNFYATMKSEYRREAPHTAHFVSEQ